MRDERFREVLRYFGLSWEGYRRVRRGVKKRLQAHMLALGTRSVKEYLERLEADPAEGREAERLLRVSISRFFRDVVLWHGLAQDVLPELTRRGGGPVRVWSAGCGCGEEAYSFRMIWQALGERIGGLPELELWATDASPDFLDKAREAVYGAGSLKEVPEEWRRACFDRRPRGNRFSLHRELKRDIRWRVHDLVREEPPAAGFHLVFLRNNLLTYYEKKVRDPVFQRIASALGPEGILILGKKERLPGEEGSLVPLIGCPYAYKKVGEPAARGG